LRLAVATSREREETRRRAATAKQAQRWLQTEYPVTLARAMIGAQSDAPVATIIAFRKLMRDAEQSGFFRRPVFVPDLWESIDAFTIVLGQVKPPGGGPLRVARVTPAFEAVLREKWVPWVGAVVGAADPEAMLLQLWEACVPFARLAFVQMNSTLRILHTCGYVMEKAFVYGVIVLSKQLGPDRLPQGVYGEWPPPLPVPPPAIDVDAVDAALPPLACE
jgi:hypothetical protein